MKGDIMNSEVLKEHGINYDEGLKRFMGKHELYEKYLKRFPEDPNFAALETALREGNTKDAFTYAHTLKGIVGNLSIDDFYNTLYDIVEKLRVDETEHIEEQFKVLKGQYEEAVEALRDQM